jgi:hypothetical protein
LELPVDSLIRIGPRFGNLRLLSTVPFRSTPSTPADEARNACVTAARFCGRTSL